MNPIALYLASGESLYAGAALLLVIVAFTPWVRNRWLLRLRMLGVWIGLAMMVMACPPFPWVVDAAFGVAFGAWLVISGKPNKPEWKKTRIVAASLLVILLLVLPAAELRWRAIPVIEGAKADHLVVMGDSISAGIGGDESRWPLVFEKVSGVAVANLSQPGAQVADALGWVKRLGPVDNLVLIEIGGNDLIAGTPTAEFERDLESLLAASARPGRTVVMFELPLLPHRIGYGRSQRRLAEKYGVVLIPKRCLIDVLRVGGATSDGLHLSAQGARAMAALVQRALSRVTVPLNH